ncbi:MAG: ABC transporter ATPase [Ferrimicrobium sp.]
MTISKFDKDRLAPVLVSEARLRLFQPTLYPKHVTETIKTTYGTVRVEGKLGSRHLMLMQQSRLHAINWVAIGNGGVKILVDPYQLRKGLTGGEGVYSQERLHALLDDIAKVLVMIDTPKIRGAGHIIDKWVAAKATAINPITGETRSLMRIDLGEVGLAFLLNDTGLYFNPTSIARLRYGISQLVANWILGQKNVPKGGWILDNVIGAVSRSMDSESMRNRRRELREDAERLASLGVFIEGDRILK